MRTARAFITGLSIPGIAGMAMGMIVVVPILAFMNAVADDGPYFPAPLLALVVVIPLACLLVPFLLLAIGLYLATRRTAAINLPLGAISGSIAGYVLYTVVFAASQRTLTDLLLWTTVGAVQALAMGICLTYIERKGWV
jgi:hypothetical protein